jgi:hypothetical protein
MVRTNGGIRMMAPMVANRRKVRGGPDIYDEGPEAKRYQMGEYYDTDFEEYEEPPPPPPPPRNVMNPGYYATGPPHMTQQYHITIPHLRNGVITHHQNPQEQHPYYHASPADTMKALEDENFMLKRRIEELKSSNEFLLGQNAQLRLSTSVAGPLAVSAVSVSASGPTAPSIIGITSSCLSGTQPLPTISISTLPIVTPVSISQTQIQTQSQPQTQIFIPAQPN